MRAAELREGPDADLATLRTAQRAAGRFAQWLHQHNADTPLADLGLWHVRSRAVGECWLLPARDVGLPQQNLLVGLGWNPDRPETRALVTTARDGSGARLTLLVTMLDRDPGPETDLGDGLSWDTFVHEFTHVLDYRRGYQRHRDNTEHRAVRRLDGSDPQALVAYFNSPIEFNGYYQQGLQGVLSDLAIAARARSADPGRFASMTFPDFLRRYRARFEPNWLGALDQSYRRKFLRRFAKLFRLVQETWPDMAAIRDIAAENAETSEMAQPFARDARLAREDAAAAARNGPN